MARVEGSGLSREKVRGAPSFTAIVADDSIPCIVGLSYFEIYPIGCFEPASSAPLAASAAKVRIPMGKRRMMEEEEEEEEEDEEDFEGDDDDDDQEEEEEEEAGGQQGGRPAGKGGSRKPEREAIYDVEGLHDTLEDIGWTTEAPWDETQVITGEDETQVEDIDDDLARELAFYHQALAATQEAIRKFEAAGTPWQRPPDYYAEMVKTDQHMSKVKEQLMFEQKQIELAEDRRKQREQKQYSKQVQAERLKQKAQDKKRQIDGISKLRKQREKSGFEGEHDYDAELKNMDSRRDKKKFQDRDGPKGGGPPSNKRRMAKDSKFGFGGSKRLKKQNDAYSAASMDSYKGPKSSGGAFKKGGGKFGAMKGGVKKKPAKQRPGKAKRQANKGR